MSIQKIKKPASVDPETWKTLQPELEQVIWNNVQVHISKNSQLSTSLQITELQTEMTKGIWKQHVATLLPEVWNGTAESIIEEVENFYYP